MTVNDEMVRLAADAAERIGPAVVRVGRGGGLVVAEGKVLTNAHNLHGEEAEVVFPDGRSATGPLVGPDVRVAGLEEGGTLQLRVVRGVEELEITVVATPDS